MATSSDGRWTKTAGNLPADGSAPPTALVVVPQVDEPEPGEWGVRSVSLGFAVDLDAGHLVDAMTRAHLDHTRNALMNGQRPDGGGEQKPLSPQALADPDRESEHRGYRSGELADGLYRTAIKSTGSTATATVNPPTSRLPYVGRERKRGVVLLTGAGAAGKAAIDAAREAAATMASGAKIITSPGEVRAKDADP
jgi:hypothetical protein